MADWVVGDIHGSRRTLDDLLKKIHFQEGKDRLFSVGDLVNRGPDSLEVLRFFSSTTGAEAVLGNHDLHLLARAAGIRRHRPEDRFDELLAAPDAGDLLRWLARRPLLLRLGKDLIVHAGVLPGWTLAHAEDRARKCSLQLQDRGIGVFFGKDRDLRLAEDIQIMTRLRIVDSGGRPDFYFVQGLEAIPEGSRPWFDGAEILKKVSRVIFGHWAMLGLYRGARCICLDSGCIYGGGLSAINLESSEIVTVSSRRGDLWLR